MKKLDLPTCTASRLFDLCVGEVTDDALRGRLAAQKHLVQAKYAEYEDHSGTKTWCELERASHGQEDQLVVGSLTKGELMALYSKSMVKSKGDARNEYDRIRLIARDECPYCGGCGEMVAMNEDDEDDEYDEDDGEGVGTLDHFLPKACFPAFSILPTNLVPSCGTCNKTMGSSFPTDPNLQPLHPYLDAPHFFEEKWTTATVAEDVLVVVSFGVALPAAWSEKDKLRAAAHFKNCNLPRRYRAKVASELSSVIDQRKTVHRTLTPEAFREILSVVAHNVELPINGWRRTLYCGLVESDWFCSHDFTD